MQKELFNILNPIVHNDGYLSEHSKEIMDQLAEFINKNYNKNHFVYNIIQSINQLNQFPINFQDKACLEKLSQLHFDLAEKFEKAAQEEKTIDLTNIKILHEKLQNFNVILDKLIQVDSEISLLSNFIKNDRLLAILGGDIKKAVYIRLNRYNEMNYALRKSFEDIEHSVTFFVREMLDGTGR